MAAHVLSTFVLTFVYEHDDGCDVEENPVVGMEVEEDLQRQCGLKGRVGPGCTCATTRTHIVTTHDRLWERWVKVDERVESNLREDRQGSRKMPIRSTRRMGETSEGECRP